MSRKLLPLVALASVTAFLGGLLVGRNNPRPKRLRDPHPAGERHADSGAAGQVFASLGSPYDRPPSKADLTIPGHEDKELLSQTLQAIFPTGMDGISDEEKCIEVCRYTVSALRLKANAGNATKIIRDGYAICGGMSNVFRMLCRSAGVPSRYVGALYTSMGSHAISEVYYGGKWHLYDATFGIFFYSLDEYGKGGEVVSYHDLLLDPDKYFAFQVVGTPWTGRYGQATRDFGVRRADSNYLKETYGSPIVDIYRKDLKQAFPIAWGADDLISYPVDANLLESARLRLGKVDNSASELAYNPRFSGSRYLGGFTPQGYHTWLIKAPRNSRVEIKYHSVRANPPQLLLAAQRSATLLYTIRQGKVTKFGLRVNDPEAIVAVFCPKRTFCIDAMEISRD